MIVYTERTIYYVWNVLVTLCAIFFAIYIPLDLVFDLKSDRTLNLCYWGASIVFFIDLIINAKKFREESIQERTSQSWVVSHGGWIIVDLIAAIPFGFIFGPGIFALLRLVKLARTAQFFRHFRQAELRFSIALTLFSFIFWTTLLVHLLCFGWIVVFGKDGNVNDVTNYISSLYWTITTLTAVGYGDIVPVTNGQRLYAIIVQLSGIGLFGYLIGSVVNILSRMDSVKSKYVENVELLTTAIKRRGLPPDLQKRILDYYNYLRDEKMGYDESGFLESLPDKLKIEVALHLKKDYIDGIPIFQNASERLKSEIAMELEYTIATPGDFIFKAGDPGDEMFFIIDGELEVISPDQNRMLTTLKEGDFFGEIALFRSQPRSASVKANQFCNLYKLKKHTFDSVISRYPEIGAQLKRESEARIERDQGKERI